MAKKYDDMTADELRPLLVAAALSHVPFDGWTRKALFAGADDMKLSHERAELCFPDLGRGMLIFWLKDLDQQHQQAIADANLDDLKIREKITACIHLRFALNAEHKEAVHRAVTTLALPSMAGEAAKANWRMADTCWRGIGDTSTDYNYYTKRLTLSAVYSSSLIYWLSDTSEDHADTWAFIDRRIDNVMQFEKVKAKVRQATANAPSLARFLGRLRYGASH